VSGVKKRNREFSSHPLKGAVKEKTVLHRKLDDFSQGYLRPAASGLLLYLHPVFHVMKVSVCFDPHQSPIGIKVRVVSSLWS
jgi:hypothetical protein